jgi:tyrosine-protein kinase Etk/Wzc
LVPTRFIAEANLEYQRGAREQRYHESVYDFPARQLGGARIDETRNAGVVQVDRPVEPERKSSPKRLLIIAITAVLSFLLVCFFVLFREAIRRKKPDPLEAQRVAQLNQYLRSRT